MNFHQSVFLEKTFSKIFVKKFGFGVIFRPTLSDQNYDSKIYFKKFRLLDLCYKSVKLPKNLKHFKFW